MVLAQVEPPSVRFGALDPASERRRVPSLQFHDVPGSQQPVHRRLVAQFERGRGANRRGTRNGVWTAARRLSPRAAGVGRFQSGGVRPRISMCFLLALSQRLTIAAGTATFCSVASVSSAQFPRLLLLLGIGATLLIRAASVSHAHDDAPFHAHQVAFASVDVQHNPEWASVDGLNRFPDSHADHTTYCSAPVPHGGLPAIEAVIADAYARTALSKPKLVKNPFDGILLTLPSLVRCKATASAPQPRSIRRDESSSLDFILRTNHAFLG